jgi:phosphinothricin acetyltransferase
MIYNLEVLANSHGPGVMDILNYYVKNSFSAYYEDTLPQEFFNRLLGMAQGYPAFAAKAPDGSIAGFAFLHPYHPAPTFGVVAELTYFINPGHTRQGLGGIFLERLSEDGKKSA